MINGLKGSNVKLKTKPPLPLKGKPVILNPKLQNSPYLNSVVPNYGPSGSRRVQSATNVRDRNNAPGTPKVSQTQLRQSESVIKSPNKNPAVKQKVFIGQQQIRQRTPALESDRPGHDSSFSSFRPPNTKLRNKDILAKQNTKCRPFSVPRNVRVSSPHDDMIEMMMMMGDAKSFENFFNFDNAYTDAFVSKNNCNTPTKPKGIKNRFSFAPESCGSLENSDLDLDIDIDEQREEDLTDKNIDDSGEGLGEEYCITDGTNTPISPEEKNRKSPTLIKGNSFESNDTNETAVVKSQKNSPSSNPRFDRDLLSESDDLLHDVVKLCDEIGLDCSIIDRLKNSTRFNSPEKKEWSLNDLQNAAKEKLDFENPMGEELANISCPSTVRNRSELESARNCPEAVVNNEESSPNHTAVNITSIIGQMSSRPNSAHSRRSSLGADYSDTYSRILSVLRHIEAEEKKSASAADIKATNSKSNSPIPFHSSPKSSCSDGNLLRPFTSPTQQRRVEQIENLLDNPMMMSLRLPPANFNDSAPSCSCPKDLDCCQSARSQKSVSVCSEQDYVHSTGIKNKTDTETFPKSNPDPMWDSADQKTKNLFSFLDEIEKSDRETLFTLKFDQSPRIAGQQSMTDCGAGSNVSIATMGHPPTRKGNNGLPVQTMDTLIRKGSVELAREVIILERKLDETQYNINLLEETLINQRELNVRNLKSSERDLKKRLKLQQEEFEMALSRHQTFVDQLISEKRALQDKCEKILRDSKENEQKYQEQIKSLQEKHLEEIKRIRKIQQNSENVKRQKWVGNKAQEIRDMTVKGLEPEVQRIIQRHQQEMSEMRAWHTDELREAEDRYQRKHNMQMQELREQFLKEKEEACRREKDLVTKRFDSELKQREEEFESQKRRLVNELNDERERFACDEIKLKDSMQENIRKAQIKGEVEIETLQQEFDAKIASIDRRHESELKSLKDINEAQKENWASNYNKKLEQAVSDKESEVLETARMEKEREIREREKKLRDEFDKIRKDDEEAAESRIKRLQEKFHNELEELEKSERDLKTRLSQAKAELLVKDEEIFTLRTTLSLKEKSNSELQESNMKMLEERVNLTSVIRREFVSQIESLENDCRAVKTSVVELQSKHKLELEHHQKEIDKILSEKDAELEKVGLRVKQALLRKEETLQELQKQLEKSSFRIMHLEDLLDQQRKDFVQSISVGATSSTTKRK